MGAKSVVAKGLLGRVFGGASSIAVIHAALFWTAYFMCGGARDSVKGLWKGLTSAGGTWASLLKTLGFPLSQISASGAGFVILMIVNSLLWGAVLGGVIGWVLGRKR
ncbi:MAG: hypothetical protein J6U40_10295 [Kiritimatiellae bacterium]|nr:hypothetical protein [Kiritimatiellia bacterium]MBP5228440.1 hypothetical protein [Kiritimatiellia bacterium]